MRGLGDGTRGDEGSSFAERPLVGAEKFEEAPLASLIVVFLYRRAVALGMAAPFSGAALPHPSRCLGSCDLHGSSRKGTHGVVCCKIRGAEGSLAPWHR